jgi:hypothetical protein
MSAGREVPGEQDAEHGQEEQLPGADLQSQREDEGEEEDQVCQPGEVADHGSEQCRAEREPALALPSQGKAFDAGADRGGRAGDVDEDGRDGASQRAPHVDGQKEHDGRVEIHDGGEPDEERHRHRRGEGRHGSPDDSEDRPRGAREEQLRLERDSELVEKGEKLADQVRHGSELLTEG